MSSMFYVRSWGTKFSRPFGTLSVRALLPTLKRWAIVVRSLRDGNPDVYPTGCYLAPTIPLPHGLSRPSAAVLWRDFCEQWRHSYLLLAAEFSLLWRASVLPMPRLESTRI